ncbi:hypothetical protein GGI07_001620 [Coemansia sp. Benny D115]|nr:hypothetical protein GGI07_001620 [Coemansia sp. Benny D115]
MQERQQPRGKPAQTAAAAAPTMLGYADGPIDSIDDVDPFTCKLGGHPLWLDPDSPIPAHSVSQCGSCKQDMVMLAQAYVPLEESAYDRVLYLWACNRRACTGRPGAAKAVRGHLLNREYAAKVIKRQKQKEPKKPLVKTKQPAQPVLDFGGLWSSGKSKGTDGGSGGSLFGSSGSSSALFSGPLFASGGFGSQAAGSGPGPGSGSGNKDEVDDSDQDDKKESTDETDKENEAESLSAKLQGLTIESSTQQPSQSERVEWPETTAAVQPQYLEFEAEELDDKYIHERYREEIDQAMELAAAEASMRGKKAAPTGDGEEWADEKYERTERPRGTDSAFERFVRIVSQNPEQIVRYQFSGKPLLYTLQDAAARQLGISATQDGYDSDSDDEDGVAGPHGYSTEALPRCEHCKGRRVFECQLMPALLSVLPLAASAEAAAPLAVKGGERLVGSQLMQALDLGLEFGTMMVFVCENDCHGGKTGTAYLGRTQASMDAYAPAQYYEELVLVQLETHQD